MLEVRKLLKAKNFLGEASILKSKHSIKHQYTRNSGQRKSLYNRSITNVPISYQNKKRRIFNTVSWNPGMPENNKIVARLRLSTPKMMRKSNISKFVDLKNETISKKDQHAMKLLLFLGIEFFFTNIPMAIVKIAMSLGYNDEPVFREFVVLSIVLEVSFAASNFYLYCICNSIIRRKVCN